MWTKEDESAQNQENCATIQGWNKSNMLNQFTNVAREGVVEV